MPRDISQCNTPSNRSATSGARRPLGSSMASFGVLWSQYGPYHFARVAALKLHADPQTIHALEIASRTSDYQWSRSGATVNLITLFPGDVAEQLPFWRVFFRTRKSFAQLKL